MDWSKSYETYLNLSDKQRFGIGRRANDILYKEIEGLVEEEMIIPTFYLMSLAQFISLKEEAKEKEYEFIKEIINYNKKLEHFEEDVKKGKDGKLASFLSAYFQKVGGEVLTAYLSMGLALLTIKGELTEEDKALMEKLYKE